MSAIGRTRSRGAERRLTWAIGVPLGLIAFGVLIVTFGVVAHYVLVHVTSDWTAPGEFRSAGAELMLWGEWITSCAVLLAILVIGALWIGERLSKSDRRRHSAA